jgi:hypothetical protein
MTKSTVAKVKQKPKRKKQSTYKLTFGIINELISKKYSESKHSSSKERANSEKGLIVPEDLTLEANPG